MGEVTEKDRAKVKAMLTGPFTVQAGFMDIVGPIPRDALIERIADALATARAEGIAQERERLGEYVDHAGDCQAHWINDAESRGDCDCGYDALGLTNGGSDAGTAHR